MEAWGKAPEAGKLRIQRQQGSRWVTVKKLGVGKGSVFVTKLRLRGKQGLRATVGSSQSVVWKQTAGAAHSSGGGSSGPTILLALFGGLAAIAAGTALLRRQSQRRRRPRLATN